MIRAILLSLALCLTLGACLTTETGERVPDWPLIATELDLGASDIRDVALILEGEAFTPVLLEVASVLELTALKITEGGEPVDVLNSIDRALELAMERLVDYLPSEARSLALASIAVVRAGLRRVRAYGGGG